MLTIAAERCVHSLAACASCRACVDACPAQAWRAHADGLDFDDARCDGCGLCLPACPTAALALAGAAEPPRLRRDADGHASVPLACQRALPTDASDPNRLPCVHALGEAELLRWHAAGVRHLALHTADCRHCPRRPAQTLQQRLARVNGALLARGAVALSAVRAEHHIPVAAAPERAAPTLSGTQPSASRRRLFGLARRGPAAAGSASATPPTATAAPGAGRQQATQALAALGRGQVLWTVALTPARCDACGACARLCPTGAVTLQPVPTAAPNGAPNATSSAAPPPTALAFDAARCIACGLCIDACEPGAWRAAAPTARPPVVDIWQLTEIKCDGCGKPYRRLQAGPHDADPARCPACRSAGARHGPRIVDAAPP